MNIFPSLLSQPSVTGCGFLRKVLCCGGTMLALSGCMVGPSYHEPSGLKPAQYDLHNQDIAASEAGLQQKASWQSVVTNGPVEVMWWKQFQDPELLRLEEDVATQNLSFQLAAANLIQSRAQLLIAGAERFPELAAIGSYQRAQNSSKLYQEIVHKIGKGGDFPPAAKGLLGTARQNSIPLFSKFQDGIDASYEVDLWGRVAYQYKAAKELMNMTLEQLRGVLIAQQADMARDYLQLRGDQKRQHILAESYKTLSDLLALSQSRYQSGLVTELDVDSIKSRLHQLEASQANLEQGIAQEMNAIALLLGRPPQSLNVELGRTADIPAVPPSVPVGLSSELAHRRPDVRAAEAQLREAVAEVGEAKADFYPKVTINADFGFQSLSFRDLGFWNARAWNVGPSISLPIFQGGRLYGQLKLKKAAQKAAAISYRQTVLQSWHDVDNALVAYHDEQKRREGLQEAADDAKRALDLATSQYKSGLTAYLNVLNAQVTYQNAEMDLAGSDAIMATNLARLYNALGGGWQDVVPDEAGNGDKKEDKTTDKVEGVNTLSSDMIKNSPKMAHDDLQPEMQIAAKPENRKITGAWIEPE